MTWGAPLVVLNTDPSVLSRVPSVRFTMGSKGMNAVCKSADNSIEEEGWGSGDDIHG